MGRPFKVQKTSPRLQWAVRNIVAEQMAAALIGKADLSDREACRSSLLATGFGQLSVDALVDVAREWALEDAA